MKIVTDSAADLPADEVETLGVSVAPLHIRFPEGEVTSDTLTPDEFYTRLKNMEPEIPTTSQPSAGYFRGLYQSLKEPGEEILSIHISSGLSGTIESARLGAQQAPEANVTVFDSLTLSGGERFQVLAAVWGARAGWSKEKILERLKSIRDATEVGYTLETLTYLARGGRIGRVQALAGALLKIKPVILVDKQDGKYNNAGRGRTIGKTLEMLTGMMAEKYAHKPVWATVLHGQFHEQADALARLVQDKMNVAKLEVMRISPVLGVHTGPGIVGVAIVPIHLMEGIE